MEDDLKISEWKMTLIFQMLSLALIYNTKLWYKIDSIIVHRFPINYIKSKSREQ